MTQERECFRRTSYSSLECVTGLVPSDDPGTKRKTDETRSGPNTTVSPNCEGILSTMTMGNGGPNREGPEPKVIGRKEILG